ncbi:MAG: carboxylesterase family protein [Acidobacteria bacterium]|nr:carboxylesterase family protein [Acidobacteriota bacterium]
MRNAQGLIGAVLALALSCLAVGACRAADPAPLVLTASGPIEGVYDGEAAEFLGIPYAAPPLGRLRWQPPERPAAWTAPRAAKAFGPSCAQVNLLGVFAGPANNNEDCLYLNVFAPREAVAQQARLPVIVWIHGGGYVDGESGHYDGSKLAVRGRTVVVTMNYRLNLMGFLAHPALDSEGHLFGNYAILDQQLALQWVQDNIASFGGDPNNVTLGGQSAGGSSTGVHLTSPLSAGLFHRAIIQSAGSYLTAMPLEAAQQRGIAFAKAVGCGEGDDEATAACLRRLPAEAVLKAAGTANANSAYVLSSAIIDGQIVLGGAAGLLAEGKFHQMPIMNGTVQDEGSFFVAIQLYSRGQPWQVITPDDVTAHVRGVFGGAAYPPTTMSDVLELYPAGRYETAQVRLSAIQSDMFVCRSLHATRLLADKVPLYVYEFRDRTAPSYFPDMPGFQPLAFHTAEIQFLFPGYHGGDKGTPRALNTRQEQLSDRLVAAWANFARTGNPNGEGNRPWPAYTSQAPNFAVHDLEGLSTISDSDFAASHQCGFWSGLLTYN